MKKLLTVIALIFSAGILSAQEAKSVGLNLYGAYIFQDKLNFDGSMDMPKKDFNTEPASSTLLSVR
jgi:hypothetical protein